MAQLRETSTTQAATLLSWAWWTFCGGWHSPQGFMHSHPREFTSWNFGETNTQACSRRRVVAWIEPWSQSHEWVVHYLQDTPEGTGSWAAQTLWPAPTTLGSCCCRFSWLPRSRLLSSGGYIQSMDRDQRSESDDHSSCEQKAYGNNIHWWIQTVVTVWKRLFCVKIDNFFSCVTLQFDVWPWISRWNTFR